MCKVSDPYSVIFLWFGENKVAYPEVNGEQMRTKTNALDIVMKRYADGLSQMSSYSAMGEAIEYAFKMEYFKFCGDPRCDKVFAQDEVYGRKKYCSDTCGNRYRMREKRRKKARSKRS